MMATSAPPAPAPAPTPARGTGPWTCPCVTPTTTPASDTRTGSDFVAERLLKVVREEINRADTKASVMMTGATAALVLLFGRDGQLPALPAVRAALLLGGAALWALGIAMFVVAVLPRTRTAADGHLTFFPQLTGGATAEALLPRVALAGRDPGQWAVEQACALGRILGAKYRWLRWGVGCLAAGGCCALTGGLW
ncbi:Pycsar system effector family protein [Streptomyces monomycini]|uniref:Pycsar system effector family protein n=1 Tax=Streptomyces monomycini TaxID=371720 RepID=UPI001EEB7752|nr:Pycsar system effector family protein [Streptomyces monomycini]